MYPPALCWDKSLSIFSIFTYSWLYAGDAGTQNTGTNTVHIVLVLCCQCGRMGGMRHCAMNREQKNK